MPVLTTLVGNPGTAQWSGDDANTTGTATDVMNMQTGSVSSAAAGAGTSGDVNIFSGTTDMTGAFTGSASGTATLASGDTDVNDAGGTGGASGDVTVKSGDAAATVAGTSGASGDTFVSTGTSVDGATGDIDITTGNATAATGNSGSVNISAGTSAGGTVGQVNVDGLITLAGVTGVAITLATVLTLADSGGIFTVAEGAGYTITLPVVTGPGVRFTFVMADISGSNDVNIVTPGAEDFEGLIQNAITSVIAMAAGSQVNFATAAAVVGDHIEVVSISATIWFVRAVCGVNGGITRTA